MEDIVERLRNARSREDSFVCNEAANEIESLRAQLAEVTKNLGVEKSTAEYFSAAHGVVLGQLLATQTHAARVVDALGQVMDDIRSEDYLFDGGNGISADTECMVSKTLSTPISLDALHEHEAQLLRGAAEKWKVLLRHKDQRQSKRSWNLCDGGRSA